jgi:ferritin-like metal-binding protein YciE
MKAHSLADLYEHELKDIYSAEKQLAKALPKLAKAASSEDLKAAFEQHLRETEEHVNRLEQLFEDIDMPPKAQKCDAMAGLIEEAEKLIKETDEGPVRDAAIIASAQRAEHYEISAYGTLRTFASQLGKEDLVKVIQETLDEESETDEKLTEIAESINMEAAETEA